MARLNEERQRALEPKRIAYAISRITALGYKIIVQDNTLIKFIHNGKVVTYYPYSGWATGASINDGRGLKHLLSQLTKIG